MVVRGEREATLEAALRALERIPEERVLFVGELAESRFFSVRPSRVRTLLGLAFDAVVLDLHDGLDADVLGQVHGLVWGGGTLVLRMPAEGARLEGHAALAVAPFVRADVGVRFARRFERMLARAATPVERIGPVSHEVRGTDAQRDVVARLARVLAGPAPALVALVADRGRGKSSALGMALREAILTERVAVTGPSEASVAELVRFAPEGTCYVSPLALAGADGAYDVILVDEAAQLSVPLLVRITRAHPRARIAFASTVHGYEGTGRGFSLRFLAWAAEQERALTTLTLEEPIRWDAGDPLERFVFDALCLDAEPAEVDLDLDPRELRHVIVDRVALAEDEPALRELFGLLVGAHYRTTPSDLHRMLDAPNLAVHALLHRGHTVAASIVAHEGRLSPAEIASRVRGHALADTLASHASRLEAASFSMVRSVRIAVHPALRRRGIARRLVDHVHGSYAPDLFGTVFGATPELVRFRRALGYSLVRAGVSLGSRTGEPAAVMVRPVSSRAAALVASLESELARALPLQLALMNADDERSVDPELAEVLREGLPAPEPLDDRERRSIVQSYLEGPRPYESAAFAIAPFVEAHAGALAALDRRERALVEARVRRRRGWARAADDAGYESVPAAMRALRRALRALVRAADAY